MTVWLLATATAWAGSLFSISPPEHGVIGVQAGEFWVPRGTTVQPTKGSCPHETAPVTVLDVDPWYRMSDVRLPQTGQAVCVRAADLRVLDRPDGDERAEREVGAAYFRHFGPIDAAALKSTPWGRVALPFPRELSEQALAQEWSTENLLTARQRERATVAEGPRREGEPVYTHFLGADAPRSDRWGTPAFVVELLALMSGWSDHCVKHLPGQIEHASPRSCTVQLGDLAWYSDQRPDPLGHKAHFDGNCVDIRLFRDDGSRYEAWWNRSDDRLGVTGGYSRALTAAFLAYAYTNHAPSTVYFNDPEVLSVVPGVKAQPGHDDHIHLCF